MCCAGSQASRPPLQLQPGQMHAMPQQPIPLHVLAEIQRAMAHASVVAKQAGGVPCNPSDIFMQGAQLPPVLHEDCKPYYNGFEGAPFTDAMPLDFTWCRDVASLHVLLV